MENLKVVARGLMHTGKKRSMPSIFVWDCKKCNDWNTHQTKILLGEYPVYCKKCGTKHILNKTEVKKEITRTKNISNILDAFY